MKTEKSNSQTPFLLPWHSSLFALSRPPDANRIWSPWKTSQSLERVKEVSEFASFLSSKCGPMVEDRNCWRKRANWEEDGRYFLSQAHSEVSSLWAWGDHRCSSCLFPSVLEASKLESNNGGQMLGGIFCLWSWMTNYLVNALAEMVWSELHSWSQLEAKEDGIS